MVKVSPCARSPLRKEWICDCVTTIIEMRSDCSILFDFKCNDPFIKYPVDTYSYLKNPFYGYEQFFSAKRIYENYFLHADKRKRFASHTWSYTDIALRCFFFSFFLNFYYSWNSVDMVIGYVLLKLKISFFLHWFLSRSLSWIFIQFPSYFGKYISLFGDQPLALFIFHKIYVGLKWWYTLNLSPLWAIFHIILGVMKIEIWNGNCLDTAIYAHYGLKVQNNTQNQLFASALFIFLC